MDIYRANQYQRINAVNYAIKYALSPNPAYKYFKIVNNTSGDCSNFISQCLYAGNAPMNHTWWYNTKVHSWSIPWAVANSLYWYLKTNQANKSPGVKGLEVKDKKLLELGDLIFYEDYKRVIFHSAIITGFNGSEPLVSQHSEEALNIPYKSPYESFRIHFLKIII